MAIRKQTDIGDGTGGGDYWALSGLPQLRRVGARLEAVGEFCLWLDEASWAAGMKPMNLRLKRLRVTLDNLDPTLSEVSAALEAVLLRPTVVGVTYQAPKDAVPEIVAREATADTAEVRYRAPEEEVVERAYVKAERGGLLEGGARV